MPVLSAIQENTGWFATVGGFFDSILTVTGICSLILSFIRIIHNCMVKNWSHNVTIQDYDPDYDYEMKQKNPYYAKICRKTQYTSLIVFRPVDCIIRKMQIIRLDNEGRKKRVAKTFRNLTPETPVCFHAERAECIPRYKIRWYTDFGEYCEHILEENCRNGINDLEGAQIHTSWISFVRKALGLI